LSLHHINKIIPQVIKNAETREVDKHINIVENGIVEKVEQNAIECSNK
jgi:hypothetical protein